MKEFTNGVRALSEGRYWDAHEAWEDVWNAADEPAEREAVHALIQLAAACHKVQQVIDGKPAANMQRGMGILIGTSRVHLQNAVRADGDAPENADAIFDALDTLEGLLAAWKRDMALEEVATAVQAVAVDLEEKLRDGDEF